MKKVLNTVGQVLYWPVYVVARINHIVLRFLLAINYLFLGQYNKTKQILKYLFV